MKKDIFKQEKRAVLIIAISLLCAWAFSGVGEFDRILFLINLVSLNLLIPHGNEKE